MLLQLEVYARDSTPNADEYYAGIAYLIIAALGTDRGRTDCCHSICPSNFFEPQVVSLDHEWQADPTDRITGSYITCITLSLWGMATSNRDG